MPFILAIVHNMGSQSLVLQLSVGLLIAVTSGLIGMSAVLMGYGLFGYTGGSSKDDSSTNGSDTRQ